MSSKENPNYYIPESNMTAAECLRTTAEDLFEEYSYYLKGVFYEDRLIELLHLSKDVKNDSTDDFHVLYKSYGATKYKTGMIISNTKITKPGTQDEYLPKAGCNRHYFIEDLPEHELITANSEHSDKIESENNIFSFLGSSMLNDTELVGCENRYNGSQQGNNSLLTGPVNNNFSNYDDPYSRLLATYNADLYTIQEAHPKRVEGYGAFHAIKNYTR